LIQEGRVEIDGQIVSELGTTVDPTKDNVRVDGVPLRQQKLVYYAVNKPTGVLSTNADPKGRQRVIDLVPNSERVFPVGRLDQNSQGLMLLTNDGDLAQQLAHPRYGVRKVYRVTVAGKVDGETMRNMRKGIYIAEGFVRVEGAKILKSRSRATELEITLREGKNREIRRILARLGHKVQVLRRIAIGPLRLGDVPPGAYRKLTKDEVRRLHLAIEHSREEADRDEDSRRRPGGGGKKRSPGKSFAGKRSAKKKKATGRKRTGGPRSTPKTSRQNRKQTQQKRGRKKFGLPPKRSGGGPVIGGD
jgi:23S rRNA pseudouridine2605 synthase